MGIQMSLDRKKTYLCIEGDIYLENAEVLRAIIRDRVKKGSQSIYLNMEGVYYIDCKSLNLLADLRSNLKYIGVSIVFEYARDWNERLQ